MWESDKKTRKHHIQDSQEVSPFPADDHKAARNRQTSTKYKCKIKDSQKKHRLGVASKKVMKFILIKEVCNLNSNLLKSGYDQEIAQSHTADQPTLSKSHRTFTVLSRHQK